MVFIIIVFLFASVKNNKLLNIIIKPSMQGKIFLLYDIDGTLTHPRQKINQDMIDFLYELKLNPNIVLGIVGGSDFEKAKEQIGEKIFDIFDYVFSENGLIFYKNGILSHCFSILSYVSKYQLDQFVSYAQNYIDNLNIEPLKKTSNFVEIRNGMINISPIGRNCTIQERNHFENCDKIHKIRETMIEDLKCNFANLQFDYSIGGQISFDVFPRGNNKTFCLDYLKEFDQIYFFGDKVHKGGNDHEIYIDKRVFGKAVTSYKDTINLCKDILIKKFSYLPIILCGGSGSRLFPLSRDNFPKQFIRLTNQYSLIQNTLLRFANSNLNEMVLIANVNHKNILTSQIKEINHLLNNKKITIILEPISRNTAPPILYAIKKYAEYSNLLILPCDHIYNDNILLNSINDALYIQNLGNKHITIFGIKPTYPETGFGYIKYKTNDHTSNLVEAFIEKPNQTNAQKYIDKNILEESYAWNSGMFMINTNKIMEHINIHLFEMNNMIATLFHEELIDYSENMTFVYIDSNYKNCLDISIDYALMEKISTNVIGLVKYSGLWKDVGTFSSLVDIQNLQNVNPNPNISVGSSNNFIKSMNKNKLIILNKVNNMIIVDTEDVLLVTTIEQSQQVKDIFNLVKTSNDIILKPYASNQSIQYEEWGTRKNLVKCSEYIINSIIIYPNKSFIQDMNKHYTVAKGTVYTDEEIFNVGDKIRYLNVIRGNDSQNDQLELIETEYK